MGYNCAKEKMKKGLLIAIVTTVLMTFAMSSCATLSDPSFHEGFRQGWNSTCPSGYEY